MGFQLLGELKLLIRCGKVSKKRITYWVSPDSSDILKCTYPAEHLVQVCMLGDMREIFLGGINLLLLAMVPRKVEHIIEVAILLHHLPLV